MSLKKDIIGAEVQIGTNQAQAEIAELSKATANYNNENERLRLLMKKLELQGKKNSEEWKKAKTELNKNTVAIKENKLKMGEYQKQIGLTSLTMKQLRGRMRELRTQLSNTVPNTKEWDRYNKELQQTQAQYTKLNAKTRQTAGFLTKLKTAAGGLLPAMGLATIVAMLGRAAKAIFDLTKQIQGETIRSVTVFGDQLGYVEEQAEKVAEKMGVTNREFVSMAANTADLLIPLDFTRKAAAEMATEVQGLAGALDEWTAGKLGVAEVSNILTKAMLGENEQLKQLGIAIRKDTDEYRDLVKQKIADEGVSKLQAEALATLELLYKKSADAQAAYLKEGNKLLRIQKSVTLWWKNMKESVSEYLNDDHIEKLQKERTEVNTLVTAISNANNTQETRNSLIDELQRKYPGFLKNLDIEKLTNEQLRDRLKEVNEEYENKILLALKDDALRKNYKERLDIKKEELEIIRKLAEKEIALEKLRAKHKDEIPLSPAYTETSKRIFTSENEIKAFEYLLEKTRGKYDPLIKEANELDQAIKGLMAKTSSGYTDDGSSDDGSSDDGSSEGTGQNGGAGNSGNSVIAKLRERISLELLEHQTKFDILAKMEQDFTDLELAELQRRNREREISSNVTLSQIEEEKAARLDLVSSHAQMASNMVGALSEIAGAQSDIGRALYVFQQGLAIAELWIQTFASNAQIYSTALAEFAWLGPGAPGVAAAWAAAPIAANKTNAAINTGLILAQTIGRLSGKKEGGYAGSAPSDDQAMGVYHANEFVANADAVRNPAIKQVLDLIDLAQRNGTVAALNLPAVIGTGRKEGGYASQPTSTSVAQSSDPETKALIAQNTAVMQMLLNNGVRANIPMYDQAGNGLMERIKEAQTFEEGLDNV